LWFNVAQKTAFTTKDLHCLQQAIQLAKEMGEGLG
jgi:hypothetical protein